MIIVGLILGPAVGLLLQDLLSAPARQRRWVLPAGFALLLIVDLSVQAIDLSLRLGLAAGILLGLLLAVSPDRFHPPALESKQGR